MTDLATLSDEELLGLYQSAPKAADIMPSLIAQESSGRPGVLGPQTPYGRAEGLTQMLPATAREMAGKIGVPWRPELMRGKSPEAAEYQRQLGEAYLQQGLDETGNIDDALRYYHGGPDRKLWGPKTEDYVQKVKGRMNDLSGYSDEELMALYQPSAPSATPRQPMALPNIRPVAAKPRKDQVLGLQKGAMTPLDNLSTWVEGGVNAAGGLFGNPRLGEQISHLAGMPSAVEAKQAHAQAIKEAAARGVAPGKIGEFAGNVLGTLPTAMLPGGILAQGAATGALLTEGDSFGDVARDAAIGAAGAKVGDVVLRGAGNAVGKALGPKAMNPAQLTAAKGAAYKAVDDLGVQYKADPFKGFISVLDDEVRALPMYDPLGHTKVNTALSKIRGMSGKAPTFGEMENLRKFIRMNVVDAADNDAERAVGQAMMRQVDDFLGAMGPSHMVQPGGAMAKFGVGPKSADPKAAVEAAQTARDLARRDFLTKDVVKGVEAAKLATERSGIGGNLDNNLRGEMLKILKANPNLRPDERAALEAAVKGSITQNALRIVGKLSPTSGALANFLHLGVGVGTGNPVLPAALAGIGFGAKSAADAATRGRVNDALRVIALGGSKPAQPMLNGAVRQAAPIAAGVGAVAATSAAQAATEPTLKAWPPGAVIQDAQGNFYDMKGRRIQ